MALLTVDDLYLRQKEELQIELVAGADGLDRPLKISDINRPGLCLAGYLEYFACDRVQVLGNTEIHYMEQIERPVLEERLRRAFMFNIPCFIISRGLKPPAALLEIADERDVPILRSLKPTNEVISEIIVFLTEELSQETTVHGVVIDIYGVGSLIVGRPGVGKSETALELVERGHRLVADDVVLIKKRRGTLYARSSPTIGHHMEIRGVGIIDIKNIFGVGSVRETKRIDLVVELEDWDSSKEYDRLGIEHKSESFLDVRVAKLLIPVRPGRSMAIILEVAALNHRLQQFGVHSAENLNKSIIARMTAGTGTYTNG
ncbi:MAG: HPr(Ser) kinase/phosphatase [Candidatus Hydrogenedentes bacterium]|nr:HPr(Ser) kinase/phosphatase [Candidatus Hydrogenedentota bacterium]